MDSWIKKTLIIGLTIGLGQVTADAHFLDLKKQDRVLVKPTSMLRPDHLTKPIQPSTSYNKDLATQSISLRFENLSLINVLQNIQEETGISFSIDREMETVPFSANVQADNWEAAVKQLLKDFSRIEVWTNNLYTSRVWVYQGR